MVMALSGVLDCVLAGGFCLAFLPVLVAPPLLEGGNTIGGYISGRGAVAAAAARAGFPMPISGWLAVGVATAFVVVVLPRSKAGIFRLNGLLLLGSRTCAPA